METTTQKKTPKFNVKLKENAKNINDAFELKNNKRFYDIASKTFDYLCHSKNVFTGIEKAVHLCEDEKELCFVLLYAGDLLSSEALNLARSLSYMERKAKNKD